MRIRESLLPACGRKNASSRFLACLKKDPEAVFWFRGFFGLVLDRAQRSDEQLYLLPVGAPRQRTARGVYPQGARGSGPGGERAGQRILLMVERDGQEKEQFELWNQADKFLDEPAPGDLIEVKGVSAPGDAGG